MNKPWWLRVTGLVTLLLVTALGVGISVSPGFFMLPWMLPILVAWTIVTVGLFVVWVLLSGMIWVTNRSARAQAAITCEVLAELIKGMQLQSATALESPESGVWDNPPTRIICEVCRRPLGILRCEKHEVTLCFPCATEHDAEDCLYIAAGRHAKRTTRSRTTGSVLGI